MPQPLHKDAKTVYVARILGVLSRNPKKYVAVDKKLYDDFLGPRIEPLRTIISKTNHDDEDFEILSVIVDREETIKYLQAEYSLYGLQRSSF